MVRNRQSGGNGKARILTGELERFQITRFEDSTEILIRFSCGGRRFSFAADPRVLTTYSSFRTAALRHTGALIRIREIEDLFRGRNATTFWNWRCDEAARLGGGAR